LDNGPVIRRRTAVLEAFKKSFCGRKEWKEIKYFHAAKASCAEH
jgi:hypothetical protein